MMNMKSSKIVWIIIVIIIVVLAILYVTAPNDNSDIDLSEGNEAAVCADQHLYEACLTGGGERGDCRRAYCAGQKFQRCAWYNVFCRLGL